MSILDLVRQPLRLKPLASARSASFEELQTRLQHTEMLLQEVRHRVGNSLQIIASMLALDARQAKSEDTRLCLVKAHHRILAVATVQHQLQTSPECGDLEFSDYLHKLAENLTASVVRDTAPIRIDVSADADTVSTEMATKMGLIVTELVINAVEHAFRDETAARAITVTYRVDADAWTLSVRDNGAGQPRSPQAPAVAGLGTGIIAALVDELGGAIETSTGPDGSGTEVSITGRLKTVRRSRDS